MSLFGAVADSYVATPSSAFHDAVLALAPDIYGRHGEASGTTLVDSSGNSRNGTYANVTLGAASLLPSESDTAATYDGATSQGVVTYASWMNATAALSLYVVAKTSSTALQSLLDRDETNPINKRVWQLRLETSGALSFFKTNGTVASATSPASGYNDGVPHHFGATYDGTNIRLYVDGAKVATAACGSLGTQAASLRVGVHNANVQSAWFNGTIDDWFVKNAVLSDADFAALYAAR